MVYKNCHSSTIRIRWIDFCHNLFVLANISINWSFEDDENAKQLLVVQVSPPKPVCLGRARTWLPSRNSIERVSTPETSVDNSAGPREPSGNMLTRKAWRCGRSGRDQGSRLLPGSARP